MKGHDIGVGATLLLRHMKQEALWHHEIAKWHAPSECHELVTGGEPRRFRRVRKRIKAETGLKYSEFLKELERRTSYRWIHFNLNE